MAGPTARLVAQLQLAHAGELAAGHAYHCYWRSLPEGEEHEHIRKIEDEEWHHLRLVARMLLDLGAGPRPLREAVFWLVEYEDAAGYARASGHPELVDCLLTMAEVEWEHEQYFRSKVTGHPLLRLFPLWPAPPPRERIRGSFAEAGRAASREPVAEAVRG